MSRTVTCVKPRSANSRAAACSRRLRVSRSPGFIASVLSRQFVGEFSGRGARIARREERAYREYVSDEQRREAGGPARKMTTNCWDRTPEPDCDASTSSQRARLEAERHASCLILVTGSCDLDLSLG